MKFAHFIILAVTLATIPIANADQIPLAARSPHDEIDWSKYQYQAPKTSDSRGPCPGLNTLANHGFLPRDGLNVTIPMALQASLDGFNFPFEVFIIAAKASVLTSNLVDQFSLNDIKLHGNIEHDTSLSRVDYALGDNAIFDEIIYATLASSNPGVDYYNATSAGQVQKARLAHSMEHNPNVTNTIKEFEIRTRESMFYLYGLGGEAKTGKVPKKFVDIFFREERLPLEEGWKRPGPFLDENIDPILEEIARASEWTPIEGQRPWLTLLPGGTTDPVRDGTIF
ncbi:hypothetical protein VNI00_004522 [Paramarasmius palmivorus]|uniref:Heme haloperoxidase family profile domain-containing protein n=1 Tax=Paramarasmius palmivorus TaxID=297713 RepID=A0AAW0DI43_9AGAR